MINYTTVLALMISNIKINDGRKNACQSFIYKPLPSTSLFDIQTGQSMLTIMKNFA